MNDDKPCEYCGGHHEMTLAEKFFLEELRRRGLLDDPTQIPGDAQRAASFTSVVLGIIGGLVEQKPGMVAYYAAALTAIARVADHQAEQEFETLKAATLGDIPTTEDPREGRST